MEAPSKNTKIAVRTLIQNLQNTKQNANIYNRGYRPVARPRTLKEHCCILYDENNYQKP
jgi:hypothetical protein